MVLGSEQGYLSPPRLQKADGQPREGEGRVSLPPALQGSPYELLPGPPRFPQLEALKRKLEGGGGIDLNASFWLQ